MDFARILYKIFSTFSSDNIILEHENIIDDIIWEVMHEDVPEIKEYLEKILYN